MFKLKGSKFSNASKATEGSDGMTQLCKGRQPMETRAATPCSCLFDSCCDQTAKQRYLSWLYRYPYTGWNLIRPLLFAFLLRGTRPMRICEVHILGQLAVQHHNQEPLSCTGCTYASHSSGEWREQSLLCFVRVHLKIPLSARAPVIHRVVEAPFLMSVSVSGTSPLQSVPHYTESATSTRHASSLYPTIKIEKCI